MKNILLPLLLFFWTSTMLHAQGNIHQQSTQYQWPTDPLVKQKLDQWQDLKFGMIIHWGLYAVPGIIESWQLCSEPWIERDSASSYDKYKDWYWGLKASFNPQQFNPDQWAKAAADAGMKYVVFTTKHHDGFNMFDTKETDFKITNGPFKDHPKANVAKYVFESFRKEKFMIGAYYSKPDWHSEYFWWPKYATPDRNVNYDIRKYAWRWNKFKQFTYNQINELTSGYGHIDILWLDGGWVRPLETVTDEVRAWGAAIPEWSQEINIPSIAQMARKNQPGLLVVDRTVHGAFENYQTPEQSIPKARIDNPWESCITLGNAWGHVGNDEYKSARKVIHLLVEVVAKGGNLLLGVGPSPEGTLNDKQIAILKEIGTWLEHNGTAIYGTRSVDRFRDENVYFTKSKSGMLNAIVCIAEGTQVPETLTWSSHIPKKGSAIKIIDTNTKVQWKVVDGKVVVKVPKSVQKNAPAIVFVFESE